MSKQGISGHYVQAKTVQRHTDALTDLDAQLRALHRKLYVWGGFPYSAHEALERAHKELMTARNAIAGLASPMPTVRVHTSVAESKEVAS